MVSVVSVVAIYLQANLTVDGLLTPFVKGGLREVYSIQLGIEIPPTPLYERGSLNSLPPFLRVLDISAKLYMMIFACQRVGRSSNKPNLSTINYEL